MTTMQQIIDPGELDGYAQGAPFGELADSASIDRSIAEATYCKACGVKGLTYHPYMQPGSYRAFAECSKCGETVEF